MNKKIDTPKEARDKTLSKIDPLKPLLTVDKVIRVARGLNAWQDYFSNKKTSLTADKFQGFLKFLAMEAPGATISRLTLFSFDNFFRPDGEIRIARELERIRLHMLKRASSLHAVYDKYVWSEIHQLEKKVEESGDKGDIQEIENQIKELKKFLDLPGILEIKNSSIDEISSRLKARNVRAARELNMPPKGGILRIALRDCTVEARFVEEKLKISAIPYDPAHLLTYAINANLLNEKAAEQAKEWWDFTVKSMGVDGARKFYEHAGYIMVTKYPLPTERTIMVIVGDPGSGKGTHEAAIEELLTLDQLTLFAKASPHKLADPREHFSRQNLSNKLALVSGDLKHNKIRDFSEINDLFGGEPQEIEKKFKDPTTENPTFKAVWASTPPLFRIDQAGGAWRRILMVLTNEVPEKNRDNRVKPRMLAMLDGFFINALLGLSYLAVNGWKFTNEQSDATIEELWEFHSDSVQVWAQNLNSEPEQVESNSEIKTNSLVGDKTEKVLIENVAARFVIDDLYSDYEKWCSKKQIEPVKPKSFSAWLGDHDFVIRQRTIEEGIFKGKRKKVTYASRDEDETQDDDSKKNRAAGDLSWEAYFSNAPITFEVLHDSHVHTIYHAQDKDHEKILDYNIRLPSWIVQGSNPSSETPNIGSGDEKDSCTILFESQNGSKDPEPFKSSKNPADPELRSDFSPDMIEGIIAELLKDNYHVHPDHSRGIGTTSNRYFLTVLKAGTENRFAELKEKLQKYSFEYVNTSRTGYLFSSEFEGGDRQ